MIVGMMEFGFQPSIYVANTNVNSAFHPSEVNKLSTSLSGWR